MAASALGLDAAHRVLARAAYGARPGEAEALSRDGLAPWVERQLALPAEEPAIEARLAALRLPIRYPAKEGAWPAVEEDRPLTRLGMSQAENWRFWSRAEAPGRPAALVAPQEIERARLELSVATLVRKTAAEAQLRERLVEFWHDHFSVGVAAAAQVQASLVEHDRRIRGQALGNFRALLEATATSPAMLFYLNNQSSRAGAPNENYARELLELHTLGRPAYYGAARTTKEVPRDAEGRLAGYVDADVWETARAFTGWTVAAGQPLDGARRLPDSGEFIFVEPWHDQYQKQVLGRQLEPFAGAMAHGRAVLDILAGHPATARFVCTKLVRFLVGEPVPEAVVGRAVAAFRSGLAAPDQIARTVRAILAGPEIADPHLGRMRRPLDAVAAAARAYALPLAPTAPLLGQMAGAGQALFGWPSPDGQPLEATQYDGAGALRLRWGILLNLARGAGGTGASPLFAELAGQPVAAATARLARLALGPAGAPVAETVAGVWLQAGRPERPGGAEVAELAGWVLTAPAFQRV
ncbi:DUF1800 domain-containing protein [Paracraurococcus lichenis]|uniref:DUF1800 domain-containing protein n=1 Tax=Paracraurococcus lichenis TaxID=3064888 RepID=A0ABT9DVT1_9PROT|nr:DUF1800 domain-containing protein [Paracraurococcus sp. LOR1-02]MDO9708010.1 DUF1800 domain-containing protein [Paracraurococcus sp. LOR1-02]